MEYMQGNTLRIRKIQRLY